MALMLAKSFQGTIFFNFYSDQIYHDAFLLTIANKERTKLVT
jgi:hypothetical protein